MESGTFADFLAQMPLGLIRLFFIFFILIIMSLVGYALTKRRQIRLRNQADAPQQTPQPVAAAPVMQMPDTPPVAESSVVTDSGDVPDLDTLLAMTEPVPVASPPTPKPVTVTPAVSPAVEVARQPGLVTVKLSSGTTVEAAEMLILSRDRATKRLIVQIGDYAYSGAEEQIDPEFRRQFVGLMKELSGIAPKLGRGAKATRSKSAPPPPARPVATPAQPAAVEADPIPTTGTLAEQIEARLQAKLRVTRAFPGRVIHVKDAPDGGVSIEVDGRIYDGVSAVTDEDVRAFIAGVVAEWQESLK